MKKTPRSMRPKIALIGRTNAGKSSLMNAICEQNMAMVSDIAGTTTDSVGKAFELIGFGPVVFYDTAGLGDVSQLGEERKKLTKRTIKNSDFAIIVIGDNQFTEIEKEMIEELKTLGISHTIVYTKSDIFPNKYGVSAKTGQGIEELRSRLVQLMPKNEEKMILEGLIEPNDKILLVCPIDTSAPQGRIIAPQVQTLREILDKNAIAITVQPEQIPEALKLNPSLVITDSQAIKQVAKMVPENIALTTFSVLYARFKGNYEALLMGTNAIDNLKDNDTVLISEACSHTTMADDIGRHQLPKLLTKHTGKNLSFEFAKGKSFPEDINHLSLIIHCGACMLTPRQTTNRIQVAIDAGIPITNYGLTISKCQGLLDRVVIRPKVHILKKDKKQKEFVI